MVEIEALGQSVRDGEVPHDGQVIQHAVMLEELSPHDAARGIVDGRDQHRLLAFLAQPRVERAVHLEQVAFTAPTLTPPAVLLPAATATARRLVPKNPP